FWIATGDGISHFNPGAREPDKRFVNYSAPRLGHKLASVNAVLESKDENIWIGTDGGRYEGRALRASNRCTARAINLRQREDAAQQRVARLLEDHLGRIWIGTSGGVFVDAR
ncbi:MAG: two-component regulator propeller domain-containing protein, partial [Bryobacteraceae bacterium]